MLAQIEKMTPIERLQAMEDIWESFSPNNNDIESPTWHENVLKERIANFKSGTARLLTIQDLKKQFPK